MPPIFSQFVKNILPPLPAPGQSTNASVLESTADAMTAFAGGGQASGTPLLNVVNRFTTVATAGDSAKLPAALPGLKIVVINSDSTDSMNVFPATGETINALSANSAFAVAAGKTAMFVCPVAGKWFVILTA